ncbi:hypothetical protein V499_02033 [Pseudogymnoascus sp. VKM F-103]|nr:hypothetical protein V499_02033 [Pseudogymnoascus sp. VKM F-103]
MSGDRSHWDSRQNSPRSPHRGGRGGGRGQYRGRGRGSYHEDRSREDQDERERERRAAAAENYRNNRGQYSPAEYRDRNRDNGTSRDSSEHGYRRTLPKPQESTPSTPTRCGLGTEFASAIQSLAEWTTEEKNLRLRCERARQDCDEARYIFDSGKPTHSQFPIEAERAKERYAKEKSALEALEAKLKEANSKISSTTTVVAQHYDSLISSKGGARSFQLGTGIENGLSEADDRFLKLERDMKAENRKLQEEFDLRLKGAEDRIRSDSRDQVVAMNSSILSKTDNLLTLSRDVLELKKHSDYHKNQLSQQQDQLREYKTAIKKLGGAPVNGYSSDAPSPGDEKTLMRIQSVETQLAAEHSSNLKLASRIETVEQVQTTNTLAMQQEIQLAVANTSSLELVPRIDAIERSQAAMLQIQDNFEQLQHNVGGFDDDLSRHDQRIKALESSSDRPQLSDTTGPGNDTTPVASLVTQQINALKNYMSESIVEIKASQDASDGAHGSLIQGLLGNVSTMEARVAGLMNGVEALHAQQKATFDELRQLLRRVGSLESDFVHMKPVKAVAPLNGSENAASASPTGFLQNGVHAPGIDWGPALNSLSSEVADINRRLAETKQFEAGINMGIRNLDTRMNNIFTDHLSKQILGQLQTVYPNLVQVETLVRDLNTRMGLVEGTFHNHTESIGYIKDSQDAVQGRLRTWESNYTTAIANLSTAVDSVRDSVHILQSPGVGFRTPGGSNEQDAIQGRQQAGDNNYTTTIANLSAAVDSIKGSVSILQSQADGSKAYLKEEMTVRMDSLFKDLKEHIEAVSKRLQRQIEDIEHLIEFDEDGKVQSVKEAIHVLTENYGKMMGEFDALDYQVQKLKAESASSREGSAVNQPQVGKVQETVPSASGPRAVSTALPSPASLISRQSGNKRSAPSSPSARSQVSGQKQTSKRRREAQGPFVFSDVDQE